MQFPDDQSVGITVASVHKGRNGEPVVGDEENEPVERRNDMFWILLIGVGCFVLGAVVATLWPDRTGNLIDRFGDWWRGFFKGD